jgi:photosynthetic reaction center H subunit
MYSGEITAYIDFAQLALYAFWIFFFGLVLYLRKEDKREGYPMESDLSERSPRIRLQGYPALPKPKTFRMAHGHDVYAPTLKPEKDPRELKAQPVGPWPGAPLEPTGNPMVDGVGPGAYALRADEPDLTYDGKPKIVPLRVAPDYYLESRDPDPRGMKVLGADGLVGGVVKDVWVDQSEYLLRYIELETTAANGSRTVLLPWNYAKIDGARRRITVVSVNAKHFADVPGLKSPDIITLLEEEKLVAYYAAGYLYATPDRLGPLM